VKVAEPKPYLPFSKKSVILISFENDTDQNSFQNFPTFLIDAPELTHAAACIPADVYQTTGTIIYLSPTLEFETQAQVNHTVAHEFAHLALKHYTKLGRARYGRSSP
jgi:hypothetical protein